MFDLIKNISESKTNETERNEQVFCSIRISYKKFEREKVLSIDLHFPKHVEIF